MTRNLRKDNGTTKTGRTTYETTHDWASGQSDEAQAAQMGEKQGREEEMIRITEEDAESIISFIKMHECEEIPDDVWEVCMKLCDELEG